MLSDRCNRRRMERLYTLVQKEKHHGKQENEESSRKEARREASFLGDYFIEERLAAGPALAASTPDDFQNKSQRGHFSKLRSRYCTFELQN